MSKTILTIKPIKTELLSSSKKTVVNQSSGQTTVLVHKIRTTVIGKQGHSGRPLTFEDLTPEQLEALRGENGKNNYELAVANGFDGTYEEWELTQHGQDGQNLTIDEFNNLEATETLANADEFLVKKDGEWKKITKSNLIGNLNQYVISNEFVVLFSSSNLNTWLTFSSFYGYKYNGGVMSPSTGTLAQIIHKSYYSTPGVLKHFFATEKIKKIKLNIALVNQGVFNENPSLELAIWVNKLSDGVSPNSSTNGILLYDQIFNFESTYNNKQYTLDIPNLDITVTEGYLLVYALRQNNFYAQFSNGNIHLLMEK